MKAKIFTSTLSALLASSAFVAAADLMFVPTSGTDSTDYTWTDSTATWANTEDGLAIKDYLVSKAPTSEDNVYINVNAVQDFATLGNTVILGLPVTEVNEFTLYGNLTAFTIHAAYSETATTSTFKTVGDFNVTLDGSGGWGGKTITSGTNNALSVEIGGSFVPSRVNNTGTLTFTFGTLDSLKINKDLNLSGQITIGDVHSGRNADLIAQDKYYYYKNADVQISGNIKEGGTLFLNGSGKRSNIISVNGLLGGGDLRAMNNNKGSVGVTSTIVLTNTSNCSFTGNITDLYSYGDTEGIAGSNVIVDVVMMGTHQQKIRFGNSKRAFRGGVTVISGDLRMYTSKVNNTEAGQWGKWGDIRLVGNDDGIQAKFGAIGSNSGETDSNARVYGDNLVWTDGVIVSGIINETTAGLIDLSGTLKKGENAASEFWFEFVGNTELLMDNEEGVKVISWGTLPTDFEANEFRAADMDDGYSAKFEIKDDGLYVSYVQVPEPSTMAAMLGLLALGFAIYRRK